MLKSVICALFGLRVNTPVEADMSSCFTGQMLYNGNQTWLLCSVFMLYCRHFTLFTGVCLLFLCKI